MALFNYMKKFYYIYLLPWERNNNIQHLFWVGKLLTNKRYTPSFPYVNQVLCKVLQMFLRTNSLSVLLNSQCVALTITLILFIFTSFSLYMSLINISAIYFGKSCSIHHMFTFWSYPRSAILRSSKLAPKHLLQIPAKDFALFPCTTDQKGKRVQLTTILSPF